jgi:ABC-2 type transport system permease protein
VPVVLLVVVATGATIVVAGRRDVGAGVLARPGSGQPDVRWLGSPARLVVRLERWVALSWIGGLALLGLLFGVVARSAAEGHIGSQDVVETVGKLGGSGSTAAAWMGYEFLYIAAVLSFAAAGQIGAARGEEADGHLDNLLARRVSRWNWLGGRIGFAVALVIGAGLATGIGGWLGIGGRSGIGFADMVQAGVNIAVPALVVLGVGTLLYGIAPRLAVPILYAMVLWSFLVEIIGTSITSNHWLLDTALLSHLGPVPAADLNWTAIGWLTGIAIATAAAGFALFRRRDLAAA